MIRKSIEGEVEKINEYMQDILVRMTIAANLGECYNRGELDSEIATRAMAPFIGGIHHKLEELCTTILDLASAIYDLRVIRGGIQDGSMGSVDPKSEGSEDDTEGFPQGN